MGMGKSVLIGYRYFLKVHLGLCHGPVNAVTRILGDGKEAWAGTASGSEPDILVNSSKLFGGDKQEGGYAGYVTVCNGQVPEDIRSDMAAGLGGAVPGYKGLTSLFFHYLQYDDEMNLVPDMGKGFYWTAMTPYIKPPAIEVQRTTAGWHGGTAWYAAKADVGSTGDSNPAHMVYESLTNPAWGMGYATTENDNTTFTAAADTLHAEGFGLSLAWMQDMAIDDFVQLILDHVDGILRLNPATGKFELKLLRDDYSIGSLPVLDKTNIKRLEGFSRAAWGDLSNSVTVVYQDYDNNEQSVTVQDLAAIASQGSVVSKVMNFPGLRSATLASRVAERELLKSSSLLANVSLSCNREASTLNIGDVFNFSWEPLGITSVAMRVVKVDRGSLTDGTVRIDAIEDVFGLPDSSYVGQQASLAPALSSAPADVTLRHVGEWPYYAMATEMSAAEFGAVTEGAGFGHYLAAKPTPAHYDFGLWESGVADEDDTYTGTFSPYGLTAASISRTATSVTLSGAADLADIALGAWGYLGDEVVRVDGVAGSVLTIARGCLDTVPAAHPAGTLFILGQRVGGVDLVERSESEVVTYKALTRTSQGTLAEADATGTAVTFTARQERPYPPGRFRLNGTAYPSTISGALTVSWAHRDRTLQLADVTDTEEASIGPEAGVTYTLRLYGETNNLLKTEAGLTGTSYTWSSEMVDSGLGSMGSVTTLLAEDAETALTGWSRPPADLTVTARLWDGSRFLATVYDQSAATTVVCESADGSAWALVSGATLPGRTESVGYGGVVIAYGGGYYLSNGGDAYSTDLVTWSGSTTERTDISDLIWDGTQFVRALSSGDIQTSPTGATWTTQFNTSSLTLPYAVSRWRLLSKAGSNYYLVINSEINASTVVPPQVYRSTDLLTWTQVGSALFAAWRSAGKVVTDGAGKWAVAGLLPAVGIFPANGAADVITARSTDGATFTQNSTLTTSGMYVSQTAYDDSEFVVVVASGAPTAVPTVIAVSSDATTYALKDSADYTVSGYPTEMEIGEYTLTPGDRPLLVTGFATDGSGVRVYTVSSYGGGGVNGNMVYRSTDKYTLARVLNPGAEATRDAVVYAEGSYSLNVVDPYAAGLGTFMLSSNLIDSSATQVTLELFMRGSAGQTPQVQLDNYEEPSLAEYVLPGAVPGVNLTLDLAGGKLSLKVGNTEKTNVAYALAADTWYKAKLVVMGADTWLYLYAADGVTLLGSSLVSGVGVGWSATGLGSYLWLKKPGHYDDITVDGGVWTPRYNNSVRVRLKAVRDGIDSHQEHDYTVTR